MGNANNGPAKGMMVPTKEAVTEAQIVPILAIIHALSPLLVANHREVELPQSLDGGAQSAIAMVTIKACNRLADILDDKRYGFQDTEKFFKTLQASQEAQLEFLRSQKLASMEVLRPSFQLKPTVTVYESGYVAFWGDITTPGMSIIGQGSTPSAALAAFDEAFDRTPKENLVVMTGLQDEPKPLPEDTAETPEQFNKKQRRKKK